jgi:hypothetical protein
MDRGDPLRLVDRGQVDRTVPGQEQASVTVDRREGRLVQVEPERSQALRNGCVVRGRQRRGVVDTGGQRLP